MASDRIHQNAQNGGTKKDKTKRKPESQGGLSFDELLKQEKGNRDQAAKRYNAQGGGKHTSSAYSGKPKKKAKQKSAGGGGGGGGGKSAPTPTPKPGRNENLAGPTGVNVPMPDTSALQGLPPELDSGPPELAGVPPELAGAPPQSPSNTPNSLWMPPMPQQLNGLPMELGGPGNAFNNPESSDTIRNMLAGMINGRGLGSTMPQMPPAAGMPAAPRPPQPPGPYGYGGSLF